MHSTDTSDDAALFAARVGAPAVVVAMAEEAQPFLDLATARLLDPPAGGRYAQLHALELEGGPVLLVRTGIGLVNAASALTSALERFEPSAVVSAGSCAGCART